MPVNMEKGYIMTKRVTNLPVQARASLFQRLLGLLLGAEKKIPNILGTLQNYDGDGKENVKKAIGLMSTTTTLHVRHAFLFISLLSLHNYDVK